MQCPQCSATESKVNDSRSSKNNTEIRRRRECLECGYRFTTFERIEVEVPLVRKHDGRREPFDRAKMLRGLRIACEKRPISASKIEKMVDKIERTIGERTDREISSSELGDLVMQQLRSLDQVAYVRFASVYREFQDVDEFISEITNVLKK